jgi:hypothetical protein
MERAVAGSRKKHRMLTFVRAGAEQLQRSTIHHPPIMFRGVYRNGYQERSFKEGNYGKRTEQLNATDTARA